MSQGRQTAVARLTDNSTAETLRQQERGPVTFTQSFYHHLDYRYADVGDWWGTP